MKIAVLVATHKKYEMPKDKLYIPIQVGSEGKKSLGYEKDNKGDNISTLNPYFCELTCLYYAYKNMNDYDYLGLVHYRRYLSLNKRKGKTISERIQNVLSYSEAKALLKNNDIILPKKRNYYIENLYDHYIHTMHREPLDITREIISEKYPNYLREFDRLKIRKSAHMFNLLIMKKDILDGYCDWLFDILFELKKRCEKFKYDEFHSRFCGRISELLLDVYINTNNLKYKEINFIDIENVNWYKKGTSFLKAKFLGKKYGKSF